jgi:rare lipoprotein A
MLVIVLVALLSLAHAFSPGRDHVNETQRGLASWYGSENGSETASGEPFDPNALTAAHRRLPFGTIVRVTNLENGRSVEVRINDRGPWRGGRILDVSEAAADVLEMKSSGTVKVELKVVRLGELGRHKKEP